MRRIFYCNYYSKQPEVKALLDFSEHIQTLSELENRDSSEIEMEDTPAQSFCDDLMEQIRNKVKSDVNLTVNASNMSAKINKEYVSHILLHLLISDTGSGIPEEKREDIFKPFLEIRDLTTGDGLGLPICKQMALKMR